MAGIQDVNIRSLDAEYLAVCVRFAQTHGITASVSHSDNNTVCENPRALQTSRHQKTNLAVDHQGPEPGPSNGKYPNSSTGNALVNTSYPQHDHSHNTRSQANTIDSAYINHTSSIPSSNDNMIINSILPQGSSPSASNTPVPAGVSKRHSRKAKTKLPKKTLPSRPQSRAVNKIDNDKDIKDLAIRNNYDPLWVQNTGVDPGSVFGFVSKMKFETLFQTGVIQEGDKLVVGYTSAFLTEVDQGVATLTHTGFSSKTKTSPKGQRAGNIFPDLVLTLSSHPGSTTIHACSGPGAIMAAFAKCGVKGPDIVPTLGKNLRVWRGDLDLGLFIYVRQAYHTWMNEMDAKAEQAGTKWRKRHGDLNKFVAVRERKQKFTMTVSDSEDE